MLFWLKESLSCVLKSLAACLHCCERNAIQTRQEKRKMSVYGYLRVSTDKQDSDNQRIGVEDLAERLGFPIERWIIDDGVSGTKEPEKRKLGKLLKKIKAGDVIICSELSRLGRKLFMIISILEHCMKIGAKVLTVKDGYELGDNVQSKVLAFAFGLVAELEREMISKRTKEALQRLKSEGKRLGRPSGRKNKRHIWNGKEEQIRLLLKQGVGKTKIARMTGMGVGSVYAFINMQKKQVNQAF
jgi:DNA invertase Pin-like site-specific DNA recombinase